jgi:hypothetical protein
MPYDPQIILPFLVDMVAEIIDAAGNTASALISDKVSHGVLVAVTGQRRNRLLVSNENIELLSEIAGARD